ncbi:MAG: ethanolamine utilization protein EutH [Clostridia bacterium]|nr:ethanolamine utilization protein EutH [Clostridia bacterium]MBO4885912.1 ethanolamine utilization protein EutH [Clostridia bacterium]
MTRCLMILMAAGAALGGLDRIFGNRLALGGKFEEGFNLLGPLALSMAGVICLMPLLGGLLERVIAPLFTALRIDPGIFGGILAIDMGGYQLAMNLAQNPAVGRFSGLVVAATFGCTAVFTIPVGMAIVPQEARPSFARGLLIGLAALPVALLAGGLLCGLGFRETIWQCMPVLIVAALLLWGLARHQAGLIRGFSALARGIQIAATAGLVLGAVQFMTGWMPLPLTPLSESMEIVASIAIVLLGSLPLAELLQRALRRPFARLGEATGMNAAGVTGLLVGLIAVTPVLGMFRDMDPRSRVVNAAATVCGASAFSAHFAFAVTVEPALVPALLASKVLGALLGAGLALMLTRREKRAA